MFTKIAKRGFFARKAEPGLFVRVRGTGGIFVSRDASAVLNGCQRVDILRDGTRWRIEPGSDFVLSQPTGSKNGSGSRSLSCHPLQKALPEGVSVSVRAIDGGLELRTPPEAA